MLGTCSAHLAREQPAESHLEALVHNGVHNRVHTVHEPGHEWSPNVGHRSLEVRIQNVHSKIRGRPNEKQAEYAQHHGCQSERILLRLVFAVLTGCAGYTFA